MNQLKNPVLIFTNFFYAQENESVLFPKQKSTSVQLSQKNFRRVGWQGRAMDRCMFAQLEEIKMEVAAYEAIGDIWER
jgi:hypothetical protein